VEAAASSLSFAARDVLWFFSHFFFSPLDEQVPIELLLPPFTWFRLPFLGRSTVFLFGWHYSFGPSF